ncbi:glycosyltransferase [Stieleria sp. TO1_6]|uniref:glycosyltransferase n=1 Tax=Stieleria tagensis TaxID=2956795 RepID=UPI00209B51BC|nr:nucleotide disphospho-sugar-binding domain-containing protein [Stieleria tagensis]MCO8121049.1 glycosyltransferase [Stieleria tagensis]
MKSTDSRPLAILSAPGSRGDVNPMIAVGRELKAIGYDVAISLAAPYTAIAQAAGLDPYALIDQEQFDQVMADPAVWKPVRGMAKVLRGVAAHFLLPHFDLIRSLHRPGRTVLVSHPLDFASRVYRDLDPSTPLVDVHLSPVMLRTPSEPARLTPWRLEPTANRYTFSLAYWLGDAVVLDRLLGGSINRLRRSHGLPAIRRILDHWWLSPDRVLAMYPAWFAPATQTLLPQLRHVGFPLDDGSDLPVAAPANRPIVFTGGTANQHSREFFTRAANVCHDLGRAGLLLSGHPECFPKSLPAGVQTLGYVPLGKLLPECSAIVHHGGVGTTSQSLRCGIPQVVRPMAFDQFDNAARVERLGCGIWLRKDRELANALERVLGDPNFAVSAGQVAQRFGGPAAARLAASEVDAVRTVRTAPV